MNLEFIKKVVDKAGGLDNILNEGKKIASGFLSKREDDSKETPSDPKMPVAQAQETVPVEEEAIELSENMTKEEEEKFLESQRRNLMSVQDVNDALSVLNKEVFETIKFCEVQKTKREKIRNDANVRIAEINAMTSCIKDYLSRSFDERDKLFDKYFVVLDEAIRSENLTLMSQTLDSINSLAASSPFKALTDINNVSRGLMSGEEWDI